MIAAMTMLAVCASAQSDKSPVNAYFTTSEMPDMLKWCPAPPDTVGAAFAFDIMQYMWGKEMRNNKERAAIAIRDAVYGLDCIIREFSEPFGLQISKEETPEIYKVLREGTATCGHTLLGWSSALLLSEINPDRADTLLARGYMYGDSRLIVGAHWQSDVNAARLAASAAYARLHTSERFLEQMRRARQEFRVKKGLATIVEMKAYQKEQKKRAQGK